jgi:putative acetyltransferase
MIIREATNNDIDSVLSVEKQAFETDFESELVQQLLNDPSAKPVVSLLAVEDEQALGHILFTRAHLAESAVTPETYLLAPMAVIPKAQNKGIGGKLIKRGLEMLSNMDVSLVFVLGYPDYYSKHGFQPAGALGFSAPYPIPEKHADAWMVQALKPGVIGATCGKVICADALNKPELWRE